MSIWDLVLSPAYLLILVYIAKRFRDKHYPKGHPLRRFYLPGLYIKFGGAIFIALIYQFYYHGGDTYNFFTHSKLINSALDDSFNTWWQLIMRKSPEGNPKLYAYASRMEWYGDAPSYTVAVIGAFLGLLNGTTYLPIALLFAHIAYTGIWAMYKTFAQIYPQLYKQLAYAFLFIPSTFVWGSGIFKDTVCMFGLGWMVYTTFRIFINRDLSIKNLFMMAMSFYLVAIIKLYILLAFIPALSLWLLMNYSHKIRQATVRWLVNFLFVAMTVGGFMFFASKFSNELGKYSLEKVAKTAETTRGWIAFSSGDEGSAYDLGDFDPSIMGMLTKFPAAVVVTLYRPFPWEAKKVIVGLSALEAILFLIGTIYVIVKLGFVNFFQKIFKDANLTFFLIFSLIFAFAVGISSYNFGALSRYKIPCLPFYSSLLIILYYSYKKKVPQPIRQIRLRQQELINT
jgi:hypothetical protein